MKFVFSLVNFSNDRYSSLFKSMSWDMDDALSVSVTIRSLFIVSWRMESSLPPLINITSCKIPGSSFSTILKVFSKTNYGKNSHTYLPMQHMWKHTHICIFTFPYSHGPGKGIFLYHLAHHNQISMRVAQMVFSKISCCM